VDELENTGKDLDAAIAGLLALVEKELKDGRPYQKVRAYVGAAEQSRVDAIEAAMPELSEANANTLVLLLLNLPEADKATMVKLLATRRGSPANQTGVLDVYYGRLEKPTMVVPADKRISIIEEPFLREIRDRLKMFTCLCLLQGFRKLAARMRARVDELKRLNLFGVFADKHPGLQHKAGVTPGGTFLIVYHRNGGTAPDPIPASYQSAISKLPVGEVVADFYLPYRCSSPLPPVVFQIVEGEPVPDTVELSLRPNTETSSLNYSVADTRAYPFVHVPDNGSLTNATAANGVTLVGADSYVFTPSLLRPLLGSNLKVELAFQYVKRGVSSPEVKVAVYNQPTASIRLSSRGAEVAPGTRVSLAATVQHGDRFEWHAKDPTGADKVISQAQSPSELLDREGIYDFQLILGQSQTGVQVASNTVRVTVKQPEETPRSPCLVPTEVVKSFRELPALDREGFGRFQTTVLRELQLDEFFAGLEAVLDKSDDEQRAFFEQRKITELLTKWLQFLAENAMANRFRLLSLETYRLVAGVALFVFCVRKEDLGRVEQQFFTNMKVQLEGPAGDKGLMDILKLLTAGERGILEDLKHELEAEVARQKALPKGQVKLVFVRTLTAVLGAFRV
jgi:hypothetical protein